MNQSDYDILKGLVITIEGLIGVGKTTLGKSLQHYLGKRGYKIKFFTEFKNLELLKLYINDMKKYSFFFQTLLLMQKIKIYEEAYKFSREGGISIMDRSILGDYTFALMQRKKDFINGDEWNVYLSLMNYDQKLEPNYTLFLQSSPNSAYEKMLNRSIQSEKNGYTIQYFEELDKNYQEVIKSCVHQVITIKWDDKKKIEQYIHDHVNIKFNGMVLENPENLENITNIKNIDEKLTDDLCEDVLKILIHNIKN